MASTMFYGMILLVTLSSFAMFVDGISVNINGDFCHRYSKDSLIKMCRCDYKDYKDCPGECDINDCNRPPLFDCWDLGAGDRIPKQCKCQDYCDYDCPTNCDKKECSKKCLAWYWILLICLGCLIAVGACICIIVGICCSMMKKK